MSATDFDRLSRDAAFHELFRCGHRRHAEKGQVILAEGDPPRSLYFIMSGAVAVQLLNWHGDEALLALMHPGDFFGEMGLFPGQGARSATVRATAESNLLEIPYPTFIELTRKHPNLWLELAGQLARRLRTVNRRMAELPKLQAKDRIWLVVTELAERVGSAKDLDGVPLRVRREDLGKLAACSREAAGLALQELAQEGRVRLRGQTILVLASRATAEAA
jgi:CRP/FNR family transcriptional regulator, cyclic AMP receptor protein